MTTWEAFKLGLSETPWSERLMIVGVVTLSVGIGMLIGGSL